MKTLLASLALFLTGCTHIEPGRAAEYHRTTTVLTVTSKADLTGIKVTDKTVKADDATFSLSFPGFFSQETVKGLVLSNPEEKK